MNTYKRVALIIGEILGYTTIVVGFTIMILLLSTIINKVTH